MPYAVVAYFDTNSDQLIRDTWKALADAGVCDYLYKSENNPHIKLGIYDSLDVDIAREKLNSMAKKMKKQKIHFKNIGIYPAEKPIVFLDISATTSLLMMQQQVQSIFGSVPHDIAANYFDPGIWKPDCFLTMSIMREKLPGAISVAMELPLPFDGAIERIGLIEFHPARKLFSCNLSAATL
jgi:hypothetical protein